jgi:outer membrane protein OmpA-like peptidoglycan-associated protein
VKATRIQCAATLILTASGCALHSSPDSVPEAVDQQPAVVIGADQVGKGIEASPAGLSSMEMARQREALVKQLAAAGAVQDWQVMLLADGSLKLQSAINDSFEAGSAQLRPASLNSYARIAGVAAEYGKTVIHVMASGDDAIPDQYRQSLSERRAASVAAFLSGRGIDQMRLRFSGKASQKPEAVQIVIKPVTMDSETQAWMPP